MLQSYYKNGGAAPIVENFIPLGAWVLRVPPFDNIHLGGCCLPFI
jgi:hypothetical protein